VKISKKIQIILTIALLIAVFTSCKSTRRVVKKPLKEYGADYLFEKLKENQFRFEYLIAKFSLDLIIDNKKNSLNGQLRIRKDSAIWISLSPALGIEMARILITNDSVKFMNRLKKTYFVGDNSFVKDFLNSNVDFDVLQSLILGNDLTYYDDGKFHASYDSKEYHLVTAGRHKLKKYVKTADDASRIFIQNIYLNPETFKITRMKIKETVEESRKLEADYSDFREVDGQLFPGTIFYKLSADTPIDVKLQYSRITTDKPTKFPFKIPSKYSRIQ
jgi:hypothetical protein